MINYKSHIINYLLSLAERTQVLKNGESKIGFDWIIYQYGLSKNWQIIRLPFNREKNVITHKTEPEFGIDLCFYDKKHKSIVTFVLKADKLTYNNWIQKGFKDDIERALTPNFDDIGIGIENINTYRIITIYNKDDNKSGIDSYNFLVKASNKIIYETINVVFERWNIDKLVDEIIENVFTPDILPSNLSGIFSYISSQFNDFNYGTTQWQNQLIPNWKKLLDLIFNNKKSDSRRINLIPFALLILKNNSNDTSNKIVGWIDLIEWAILKLFEIFPNENSKNKKIIIGIFFDFYISELANYFDENAALLCSFFGVKVGSIDRALIPINTANSIYWHIGRLGILALSALSLPKDEIQKKWLKKYQIYMTKFIIENPLSCNPLLDINHIEIFEIFLLYILNDKKDDLFNYFDNLLMNLVLRRQEKVSLPFIEASNRLDLVAERVATNNKPLNWNENSSYLLTMLLEMSFVFEENTQESLVNIVFENILKKYDDDDDYIDLVSWLPPENWDDIVFKEDGQFGTGINTSNFADFSDKKMKRYEVIKEFIKESRSRDIKFKILKRLYVIYILACLKNKTPIPPEFWRAYIF